jgi:hypothetical protein
MSTTELDQVMALLKRILPDPAGYGERLIQQVVLDWAEAGQRSHPVVPGETVGDSRTALLNHVLRPEEPAASSDVYALLASALGACDCWGRRADCPVCNGAGRPGWADPDPELFQEYVGPATARLGALWDDTPGEDERLGDDHRERPRQGVIA